jgi:tRNA(fMet)-specific endonuclease VapC
VIEYLLDTDSLSYLMKPRFTRVQLRYALVPPRSVAISAVTLGEILFGLESLGKFHPVTLRTTQFLDSLSVLDWPADAASIYAEIRHKARAQPLGDRDIMIAAHAIAIGATVVTNNIRHFGRMSPQLRIENWMWEA